MLPVGAGESGKSTIVKQMKILHVDGFDSEFVFAIFTHFTRYFLPVRFTITDYNDYWTLADQPVWYNHRGVYAVTVAVCF